MATQGEGPPLCGPFFYILDRVFFTGIHIGRFCVILEKLPTTYTAELHHLPRLKSSGFHRFCEKAIHHSQRAQARLLRTRGDLPVEGGQNLGVDEVSIC